MWKTLARSEREYQEGLKANQLTIHDILLSSTAPLKTPIPGRWLATHVANRLQKLYEAHRVPETWGSPSVSHQVFDMLRHHGFFAAGRELVKRMREGGILELSTTEKMAALLTGIGLVTMVDLMLQQKKPIITRRYVRIFSPYASSFAVACYTFGAALLVTVSGPTESSGEEYSGLDESTEYRAYGRTDEEMASKIDVIRILGDEMDERDNPTSSPN